MPNISRLSKLFQPVSFKISTSESTKTSSKSYDNLIKYGFIKKMHPGMFAFLPLGLRVLNKLTAIVDNEMDRIGAQKLLLPALTSTSLWKKTGRYDKNSCELFKLQDRDEMQYLLGPTYEEAVCSLLSSIDTLSQKMLPLKLYQISNKWRDEMKPRLGFVRSREFIMQDLYTFDLDLESGHKTYEVVCNAYDNIFKKIGLPFIKAIGDPGFIGGQISHEYHYMSNVGEDIICICPTCQYAINKHVCKVMNCNQCKITLQELQVVEMGHTFLLNTKYTLPLDVHHTVNNEHIPLVMGCFGLGLSRMFALIADILSTEKELRWPKHLAPYTVCIIPPKKNSKEESGFQYVNQLITILDGLNIDAILDDRTHFTIGKRLLHARLTGFPYVIILGKSIMKTPPLIEIHNINDSKNCELPMENIVSYFNNERSKN